VISPAEWVERYAAAWRAADPAAAASLFTPDAHYTSDPFGPGLHGRDEIAVYWAQAVSNQEDLDLCLGSPVADGNRAATEWRASFRRDGVAVTLAACLMLRFDAEGLCDELREYWRQR
jgi:limonene-1,2-epoxide hydrolase